MIDWLTDWSIKQNWKIKWGCFYFQPDYVYEEVLKQFKTGHCRLNKLLNVSDEVFDFPELFSTPNNFESQHPRPRSGIFSHCAVFSDYPNCEKS